MTADRELLTVRSPLSHLLVIFTIIGAVVTFRRVRDTALRVFVRLTHRG